MEEIQVNYALGSGMMVTREQADKLTVDYQAIRQRAAEHPLDLRLSYPRRLSIEEPLIAMAENIRRGVGDPERIDNDHEAGRISEFFGAGHGIVLPEAGTALSEIFENLLPPNGNIFVQEPAYPFRRWTDSLSGGQRELTRIPDNYDNWTMLKALVRADARDWAFITEGPRKGTQHSPQKQVLDILGGVNRGFVLYDNLNCFYGDDILVERDGNGNRLVRGYLGKGRRAVTLDGLSKLFTPGILPNLAVVEFSPSLEEKIGSAFRENVIPKHFRSPNSVELKVAAELLHSEEFRTYFQKVRELSRENFEYIRNTFGDDSEYDGSVAFIPFMEGDAIDMRYDVLPAFLASFGLLIMDSTQFLGQPDPPYVPHTIRLRVPLVMDRPDVKIVAEQLYRKMEEIYKAEQIYRRSGVLDVVIGRHTPQMREIVENFWNRR